MRDISKLNQNKIELKELQKYLKIYSYNELYIKIIELIENEKIKPIKSSKTNGKTPALYNRYTIIKKEDINDYTEELLYKINTRLEYQNTLKIKNHTKKIERIF